MKHECNSNSVKLHWLGNLYFQSVFTVCLALWPLALQIEDLILRWLDVCGGVQPDPFRGPESMCLMTSFDFHSCGPTLIELLREYYVPIG